MRNAILFCSLLALGSVRAQESSPPSPSPTLSPSSPAASPLRRVPLRFALPPLDGTISLGIYDHAGQLVRVLHREDAISEFTVGHDALETVWDGNDEKGNPLPNGKYSARGYVVGDLKIEGVDYFFNDWVTDEKSPHILRLTQLWMEKGELRVDAELTGGRKAEFVCDQTSGEIQSETTPVLGIHCKAQPQPNVVLALDCAAGKNDSTWFVDSLGGVGPREVKQVSKEHELLRRLQYAVDDPQPERIEVSPTEEQIFLIEQNDHLQRFRALTLVATTKGVATGEVVSDWKTHFEKKIFEHKTFSLENDKPTPNATIAAAEPEKFSQTLRPDPLQHDKPGKVELAVGLDLDGSYLKTADGLPLRTISDTPHLFRTVLARHGDDAIDVFQDDGAVVEQFRVSNLAQMIAFDCGDFELQ